MQDFDTIQRKFSEKNNLIRLIISNFSVLHFGQNHIYYIDYYFFFGKSFSVKSCIIMIIKNFLENHLITGRKKVVSKNKVRSPTGGGTFFLALTPAKTLFFLDLENIFQNMS